MTEPRVISLLELQRAKPTVDGEKALRLVNACLLNPMGYVYYEGAFSESSLVYQLAEQYFNRFAYVEFLANHMYTPHPIQIPLVYKEEDGEDAYYKGGIWNNGYIFWRGANSKETIHLWIDPQTVEIFRLPTPDVLAQNE